MYPANELQEGGHGTVGDGACTNAEDAPKEGGGVAGLEAKEHEAARYCVVIEAFAGVILYIGLEPAEFFQHTVYVGEGEDQHPVLQAFLHELLEFALTGADLGHELPELPEE